MYRFILFYFVLYICIYVPPWSCEARHLVPLYVHTCSGMTIKLNLTWLDLTWIPLGLHPGHYTRKVKLHRWIMLHCDLALRGRQMAILHAIRLVSRLGSMRGYWRAWVMANWSGYGGNKYLIFDQFVSHVASNNQPWTGLNLEWWPPTVS